MTAQPTAADALHPWHLYLQACEEARRRGDRRTGTDHLVLGLLENPAVEGALGVSLQRARQALDALDQEALGALGIGPSINAPMLPVHPVPRQPKVRDVMRRDRLRMTPAAKRVLEEAFKPMRRGRNKVTPQQVLAQLLSLQAPDPAAVLLAALGVDTSAVRRRLDPHPA